MATRTSKTREPKRFTKSRSDRMIDGVCGGTAAYLGVDSTLVRIVWALSVLVHGLGLAAYVAAMILAPPEEKPSKDSREPGDQRNGLQILGIGLVVAGFYFLVGNGWFEPVIWPHHAFGWRGWETGLPVLLILAGVLYLVVTVGRGKASQGASRAIRPDLSGFKRSDHDKVIAGICGALASRLNADSTLVRIALVAIAVATHPVFWILAYGLGALVIPVEREV